MTTSAILDRCALEMDEFLRSIVLVLATFSKPKHNSFQPTREGRRRRKVKPHVVIDTDGDLSTRALLTRIIFENEKKHYIPDA